MTKTKSKPVVPAGGWAPAWMARAACATSARHLPWTTDTHRLPDVLVDCMRNACDRCPVRFDCTQYVSTNSVSGGFWAGHDQDTHPDLDTETVAPQPVPAPAGDVETVWMPVTVGRGARVLDNAQQGMLAFDVPRTPLAAGV